MGVFEYRGRASTLYSSCCNCTETDSFSILKYFFMVIKFSNKPPSSWNAVTFPGGTVATWLTDHMKAANCAVKKRGLFPLPLWHLKWLI